MRVTIEPGTLFYANLTVARIPVRTLLLLIREPRTDSKLNIHTVYNFRVQQKHPYIPDGKEEIIE